MKFTQTGSILSLTIAHHPAYLVSPWSIIKTFGNMLNILIDIIDDIRGFAKQSQEQLASKSLQTDQALIPRHCLSLNETLKMCAISMRMEP